MTACKALFVCEKWAECDPTHGLSNVHHNFIGSFVASGVGTCDNFFFDEHVWKSGERCDAALLDAAKRLRPDVVFVTPVRGSDLNPTTATLSRLRDETGARLVVINGDTYDDAGVRWCEVFASVADLVIVIDCYSAYPGRVRDPSRYLDAWTPQDPTVYHHSTEVQTIDVCFLGSVARYPDRKRALGMLEAAEINVVRRGGQAESLMSIENYAATLRRSKIILNFARPVFDISVHQCKGRVIEATLSGALLFEQANPETDRWLTRGRHYVAFDGERDLVDKTRYYLAHEQERAAIAAAGTEHAERHLSAQVFWHRALNAVQIPAITT